MSSSAICQNFVQNAWKKELCSNCFKSKDEHAERPKPKPIKLIASELIEGIIRDSSKSKPKRNVAFTKELTQVIGYGGEDWDDVDNGSGDEESESSGDDDYVAESEEEELEKELKRLTKENTDFNANQLKNEVAVTAKKTVTTQLMLGKPLVDASGRKQTLLVSVTPFGEDVNSKKFIRNMSHIPISKNSKEKISETKSNIVLTSYTKNVEETAIPTNGNKEEEKSLLDEISETLENSKNPIQIISRKKTQKEITLQVPRATNDVTKELKKLKDDENNENKLKGASPERKIGLTRTPALKRDYDKPPIYQTSTAKIELLSKKRESKDETDLMLKSDPNLITPQSREQAGEPDGRADPETVVEPPALPLTPPPPLKNDNTFLHGGPAGSPIYEKPKVPSKPATVLIRKGNNVQQPSIEPKSPVLSTFSSDALTTVKLAKQDSNGSDVATRLIPANKRKAPKPPENEVPTVYLRHSANVKTESPIVREKEKRERASSCSPKIRNSISGNPQGCIEASHPEPAPRKTLSMSTDSLAVDDKRKDKSKGRFSLKKFLRMGTTNRETGKQVAESVAKIDERTAESMHPPLPKPRLIIVHPTELNGAKVEVVANKTNDYQNVSRFLPNDGADYETYQVLPLSNKAQKPPPPPRNLDIDATMSKPNVLPKSADIMIKQKQFLNNGNVNGGNGNKTETVYANIGEVRSAIVPNKPQRTASMREREAQQQQQQKNNKHEANNNYEIVDGVENVYDYINTGRSSSPDSDSSRNKNSPVTKTNNRLNKRCESSIDVSGEYFKFGNIPRSMSLTYCGSETESEIYSPYSFYGSESEITEDDHDWIQNGRTHKLRSKKGRSIVHKNLEDNYGAVIVANHEALAQVLENIQQTSYIQPALRGLKALSNLRYADFSIITTNSPLTIGSRTFQQALWNNLHVTLLINYGAIPASSTISLGNLNLTPITEFSDLIPSGKDADDKFVQATVSVLPWLSVSTIQGYNEIALSTSKSAANNNNNNTFDINKDSSFILLQLINALKILQAQGIEELPLSLNSFVLCKDMEKDTNHRLYVLQGFGEELTPKPDPKSYGTLCMCAYKALNIIQPASKITPLLQSLLNNERAVSLTQVKSILEFCLWGPSDVSLGSTIRERELALQRWLDLQRATVLHGLVCTRVQLTVYEECHLSFLVRSNSRMMSDASLLLESSNMKHILNSRS